MKKGGTMPTIDVEKYEALLEEAGRAHGDICAGIRIGTRMTMCALHRLGLSDPKGADRKKLMVFVEIDRCATDAIMALTGCRPGKRTMKVLDYGKMAASFINLETGKAVRISSRMKRKEAGQDGLPDMHEATDEELFLIENVEVPLRPEDMPGRPLRRIICPRCGEHVLDGRDVEVAGEYLCRPCATQQRYYRVLEPKS
jgi:formylmethanofuran dehydrogenase subunit E